MLMPIYKNGFDGYIEICPQQDQCVINLFFFSGIETLKSLQKNLVQLQTAEINTYAETNISAIHIIFKKNHYKDVSNLIDYLAAENYLNQNDAATKTTFADINAWLACQTQDAKDKLDRKKQAASEAAAAAIFATILSNDVGSLIGSYLRDSAKELMQLNKATHFAGTQAKQAVEQSVMEEKTVNNNNAGYPRNGNASI